jgi:hypothetical protein
MIDRKGRTNGPAQPGRSLYFRFLVGNSTAWLIFAQPGKARLNPEIL